MIYSYLILPLGYVKDPHHFYLMGLENYKKFQRTAAEKFLHIQEGYTYCPFEKCGASFIVGDINEDGDEGNKALCPECQRLFCLKCKSRGDCVCNAVRFNWKFLNSFFFSLGRQIK
jgi:hypothetical protein